MAYVSKKYANNWQNKGGYLDKDVAIKIIPAPIGGWDAISPLAAMEPKYAASIVNWVPRTGWLELRGGYNAWVQAITASPVTSGMVVSCIVPTRRFEACGRKRGCGS